MNPEVEELLQEFTSLLRGPSGDGQNKRDKGEKPLWKFDPSHAGAAGRHIGRWLAGERVDPDSGSTPLAHGAWRFLGVAWQIENGQVDEDVFRKEFRDGLAEGLQWKPTEQGEPDGPG